MEVSGERIEGRVQKAIGSLKPRDKAHKHSDRCLKLIRHIMSEGEETILECKQSMLHSISPTRVIATTRRMIIVRPSFWGLYLGHDLFSPTEYNIIPYKQLISVIMSKGRMLSTIHMRIHGFTDTTSAMQDEGEIYGIRTENAIGLANFLEEIIEYREDESKYEPHYGGARADESATKRISLEEARLLVSKSNSKFVWLGIEPLDYVTEILGVSRDKVFRATTAMITEAKAEELLKFKDCVFVCYNGAMGNHFASFLNKEHKMETYVLKDGISGVAHAYFNKRN